MPPQPDPRQQQPAYIDADHQRISEFAGDYFDDDDERETFVTELMTRRGYTPKTHTSWEPPEPKQGGQGGGGKGKPSYFKQR